MTWGNQNTEKEAHEQLSYAFDNGVNIFDSAEVVIIVSCNTSYRSSFILLL